MMGTKFDIKKFDGKNEFALWQVRMKALLEQQGLAAALEELPATTIAAYDNKRSKEASEIGSNSESLGYAAIDNEVESDLESTARSEPKCK
ncbi:hypothetical protein Tco_1532291 [Tanacetum coccineum]